MLSKVGKNGLIVNSKVERKVVFGTDLGHPLILGGATLFTKSSYKDLPNDFVQSES